MDILQDNCQILDTHLAWSGRLFGRAERHGRTERFPQRRLITPMPPMDIVTTG